MPSEITNARSSRRSAGLQSILNVALVAVILVLANWLGFKHYVRKDMSESQLYTLSPKTVDVLKKLDAPIAIYTYLNEGSPGQVEQLTNLLKQYAEVGGKNITIEKIDPVYDPSRAIALQKQLHFDGNDHLVIMQYKDRSPRFVKQEDFFDINPMNGATGAFKGEQQLTASIIALVEGQSSKVYFTEGHGEHSIHDLNTVQGYGTIAGLLKNENVDAASVNLTQKGEVPADAEALVIAGPTIPFSALEADVLDKYLAANGKLIVLLDPYRNSGLDLVLQKYGIKYEDDLVLFRGATATGGQVTLPLAYIIQGGFSSQPITTKFAQANLPLAIYDARSITLPLASAPQPKTQFLLQTDADAWGWISKGTVPDSPKDLTYNKVTDIAGPVIIAAQYDGGTTTDPKSKATLFATRIVAVGSSKFLENDSIEQVGANFFTNSIDWLVKKDAVLDIAPKKPAQYGISLNGISYNTVVWSAAFFIPGAALILGILTWFSRRK